MKRPEKATRKPIPSGKENPVSKKPVKSITIPLWPGLIAALFGFAIYANTLSHEYTLDDYSIILENRLTKQGWDAFPEILTNSYRYGYYFTDDDLYRPIPKAMFAAEWGMFGENASPSHWINVLLFALTGWVIFRLVYRLKPEIWLAFGAAILFMAHPVHTEVVANIKSRDEILALLLCLLSLEQFLFASSMTRQTLGAGLLYFLALLSKESSITFLAIFPLAAWMQGGGEALRKGANYVAPAAVAILFLLIRASVLSDSQPSGEVSIADNLLMAANSGAERFATAVVILGLYLKLLFIPHPLAFDYSFNEIPIVGAGNIWFLLSFIAYIGLLILGIRLAAKRQFPGFAILFYLITLSIYSNIFITIGSSMGERFLYMPSLGFCLAMGWIISRFARKEASQDSLNLTSLKPAGTALLLVFTVAFASKTIARNPVWKNNATLYENDVLISANSTRTHYYLGNYLVKPEASEGLSEQEKQKVIQRGISELRRSIEIFSGFADAHLQLGVAYDKLGQPDSAFAAYQRALALNPQNATIHNNIGTLYFKKNDFPNALNSFLKATALDPRYAEAHANAGSAYGMMQQYDNALSSLFQAIKWDPGYAQAYYFISITYKFKGDQKNADAYLAKAKSLDPKIQ